MTTPEQANQGRWPVKGLNHQILLEMEAIVESNVQFATILKSQFDGSIYLEPMEENPDQATYKFKSSPRAIKDGDSSIVAFPEEWNVLLYILSVAVYFDVFEPLERYKNTGMVDTSQHAGGVVNDALNAARELVTTGRLHWPNSLPPVIGKGVPQEEAWQRISALYIVACLFIYFHEFSHIKNGDMNRKYSSEERKEVEHRCDAESVQVLLDHFSSELSETARSGIMVAIGAIVFVTQNESNATYPEPIIRAKSAFETAGEEMTVTMKLVHVCVCAWTCHIKNVDSTEIKKIVNSMLDIDEVSEEFSSILRRMA